jgi:glycosyltransferase involved in cell wall biosynthesis
MNDSKKELVITYLYSEVMAYAIGVMRELHKQFGARVYCVFWDNRKLSPYIPDDEEGITFLKRSNYDDNALIKLIAGQNPSIIYVSGTMDKGYLKAALYFRRLGVKLVAGTDNKWFNNWKQRIQILFSWTLFRKYFEYVWIPGTRQYAFVRLLGYNDDKIVKNLYSANTNIFFGAYERNRAARKEKFPHTFVYVGRFSPEKGVDVVYNAFMAAKKEVQNDWKLIMVGATGNSVYKPSEFVDIQGFMPNSELPTHAANWGVFCVSSYREKWGVVIHEFAAAGLPMLCVDCAGANEAFLVPGYNGYDFLTGSPEDMKKKMLLLMSKTDDELFLMGERSHEMAHSINPVLSAYSLMSILI